MKEKEWMKNKKKEVQPIPAAHNILNNFEKMMNYALCRIILDIGWRALDEKEKKNEL